MVAGLQLSKSTTTYSANGIMAQPNQHTINGWELGASKAITRGSWFVCARSFSYHPP
jgi:hypothetical protein